MVRDGASSPETLSYQRGPRPRRRRTPRSRWVRRLMVKVGGVVCFLVVFAATIRGLVLLFGRLNTAPRDGMSQGFAGIIFGACVALPAAIVVGSAVVAVWIRAAHRFIRGTSGLPGRGPSRGHEWRKRKR